ncbi:MAG TPA: hypothetical protein VHV75_10255 [Solirubrobacteraceae bacterium]|jgi:hypothetical protein|nr:hypothetical protein [Solirubrobacteraceae bacterium]
MAPYDIALPQAVIELAKKHGFSPNASVIPSALGRTVATGLSPQEYDQAVDSMLSATREAVREAVLHRTGQAL